MPLATGGVSIETGTAGARALQALRDTFTLGMLIGDADLCASVYTPDGLLIPPDGRARRGRDEIKAFWQRVIDAGGGGDSVTCESIRARGQLLIEEGVYARFPNPVALGPPVARGTYLLIVEPQEDGAWAWSVDLWTDTRDDSSAGGPRRGSRVTPGPPGVG